MAFFISVLCFLVSFTTLFLSTQQREITKSSDYSLSFSLTAHSLSPHTSPLLNALSISTNPRMKNPSSSSSYNYKSSFKYSMALVVSLPIGTPPQTQQMVLDTGSQLSWIQCHNRTPAKPPPTTSFDPSLSSSFSVIPCNHPLCKPRVPDFTLPTSCGQNRLCHYSYFYADGTLAEGDLVQEKFTFSTSQTTPPMTLGCATDTSATEGILGMNLGRLSFATQSKISQFSYCVPVRSGRAGVSPTGTFYLGQNPNSGGFQYVDLLTFGESQRMPNFDPLAYTVGLEGIRIGGKRLNISRSAFRPDPSGAGQTMVDSGTEYTFLVEEAYAKVREEVVRLAGPKIKKGYVYGGALDMCFDGYHQMEIGRLVGDMVLEFEKGVEIVVPKERISGDVGNGGKKEIQDTTKIGFANQDRSCKVQSDEDVGQTKVNDVFQRANRQSWGLETPNGPRLVESHQEWNDLSLSISHKTPTKGALGTSAAINGGFWFLSIEEALVSVAVFFHPLKSFLI
ncbi:Xylanase inhibitor, N-terminal [Dillenia turbinata]|uniref:Xylanase inhibitor, N-terminal n=1 Tax=Dillenia turbinata TaxID=194707 RepID=A0AAN8YSC1_9MAGN